MKVGRSAEVGIGPIIGAFMTVILLFFILPSCASRGRIDNFYLNPADGERSVYSHDGLMFSALYLDREEQSRYLRANEREALAREIKDLPLSAFLLEIVNGSNSELIVDPASIRFATGSGPLLSPVSYAHLYMSLPRDAEGRQTVLQELKGVVFDRPVTVPSGGREEGLVLFQRPEAVARDVAIVLDGLYLGGAQLKAVLDFRAVPLEK